MKDKWRLAGLLGSWHQCSKRNAFRFYERVNQRGERRYFADYRVEDLTSRHHKLLPVDEGLETSFKIANQLAIDLTRQELADL